jgi:hypothetical protein
MLTVVLKVVKMLLSCCPKNSQDAAALIALKAVQDAEKKPPPQRPSTKTYSQVLTALKAVQDAEKKPPPQRTSTKTYSHQFRC